jgi:hypothetical protein
LVGVKVWLVASLKSGRDWPGGEYTESLTCLVSVPLTRASSSLLQVGLLILWVLQRLVIVYVPHQALLAILTIVRELPEPALVDAVDLLPHGSDSQLRVLARWTHRRHSAVAAFTTHTC